MFAKSGLDATAPCARPLLRLDHVSIFEHACRQPFRQFNRMIRRSPTRCSTKRISQSRLTLSKKD